MQNIIYLDEIRIRKSILETEEAIKKVRMLMFVGVEVPDDVMPRLENILSKLEQDLIDLFENDIHYD
tara:strand:- start:495 stop:695 length:201 start_codon:yes stop_codon:yes gene_type:complete